MKMFVVAAIFVLMQAAQPIPSPQATGSPVRSQPNAQSKPRVEQTAPIPIPSVSPSPSPAEDQNTRKQPSPAKNPEPVLVHEVAPSQVDSFWWNRSYVIFTGILMVIGGFGSYLAFKTLRRIERQTIANEGQLAEIKKSSEQNAKILALAEKQAENARVIAEATRELASATKDAAEASRIGVEQNRDRDRARIKIIADPIQPQFTGNNFVTCQLENVGYSRAYILESFGIYLHSDSLNIEPGVPPNRSLIFAEFIEREGRSPMLMMPLQPDTQLTASEIVKIRAGESYLHFYGFVRYRDVFKQVWRNNIHLRWVVRLGGVIEGQITEWWEPVGPPEENAEIQEQNPS